MESPEIEKEREAVEDDDAQSTVARDRSFTVYRVLKTLSMVMIWVCMGFFLEIVGPTLTDLKDNLGVNYEEISRVLSARSAGYFIGSLVGGFLKDRFPWNVDTVLGLSLVVAGLCTAVTPWLPYLEMVGVAFHIVGWCEGFLDTGGNCLLLQLWGENAPAPVQSIHFGFGVGAFLSPYLARPFLAPLNSAATSMTPLNPMVTNTWNTTMTTTILATTSETMIESRIEIPYLIIGIVTCSTGVLFALFQIIKKRFERRITEKVNTFELEKKRMIEIISPASCANGSLFFGTLMFLFLFIFYIQVVGGERAYGKFIASFAKESNLKFSNDDAVFLNSIFWAGFMSGRFISIVLAHWLSPKVMLPSVVIGGVITSTVLASCWHVDPLVLWIGSFFSGFFISPIFPTGVLWADRYLTMTGMAVSVLFLGGATGGFIYQWLTGYLFEYYGPPTLMYVMAGYAAILLLLYIVMQTFGHFHGDRFKEEENNDTGIHQKMTSTTAL